MPTSHSEFDQEVDGLSVTAAFREHVQDKIILITGVNADGIGGATVEALATQAPKLLIAAGRNLEKVRELIRTVQAAQPHVAVRALELDLSSQASCRAGAAEIIADDTIPQLDIIINNAGVMNIPERQISHEGIEMHFAVNHIGHFLFTNLIMPKLQRAAKAASPGSVRIVNVSSRATIYGPVRFSDWNFDKEAEGLPLEERPDLKTMAATHKIVPGAYAPMLAYSQSKTANVLFSIGLTRRLHKGFGIMSLALHPGVVETELARHAADEMKVAAERLKARGFFFKTPAQGAATQLVAALDPALAPADSFLSDCQIADWAPKWSTDAAFADRLWTLSEQLVGQKFEY
ncbi:NAD(P)-binding protein [Phaeosphaeriaceae sp. SRC1lsM3a]|nr:NAD(P)-binding protein [Stagonospora sp. SRC1lsM3a]